MQRLNNPSPEDVYVPKTNVWETNEQYLIVLDIPGTVLVNTEVKDGFLILTGCRELPKSAESGKIRLLESAFGQFQRRIKLNSKSDLENISCTVENGVVTIKIPKRTEP